MTTPDINAILKLPQNQRGSRYGAPMGDRNVFNEAFPLLHVQRIHYVDGDYGADGTYWGGSSGLYCGFSMNGHNTASRVYVRAETAKEAKAGIRDIFPDAQFVDESYDLSAFLDGYVQCALWSSIDDAGRPLDDAKGPQNIPASTLASMREECQAFINSNIADLKSSGQSEEQAGHDFWLTRNGHGAGFWDRGLGKIGNRLTASSKAAGSSDLYVGRGGWVYVS